MILQRRWRGKEHHLDAFVAGLLGGWHVFGRNNNINNQIVLYLFSRILIGIGKTMTKRGMLEPIGLNYQRALNDERIFTVFAATVWGCVMWLFRHERDTLQPSLQSSMHYLYIDSDKWTGLRNWIWHNV
jgi:peroxisomal membrane protein 4